MLSILLETQPNPLGPLMTLIGFAIAMIWLFTRQAKKNNKDKIDKENRDDNKDKMI